MKTMMWNKTWHLKYKIKMAKKAADWRKYSHLGIQAMKILNQMKLWRTLGRSVRLISTRTKNRSSCQVFSKTIFWIFLTRPIAIWRISNELEMTGKSCQCWIQIFCRRSFKIIYSRITPEKGKAGATKEVLQIPKHAGPRDWHWKTRKCSRINIKNSAW